MQTPTGSSSMLNHNLIQNVMILYIICLDINIHAQNSQY